MGYIAGVPPDAGKSVLLRMLEMFASGDVDAARETVADDYCDHEPAHGGEARGVAGFCDRVEAVRKPYVVLDVWPEGLITEQDTVTARLHWQGVLPTGEQVDRITIEVVRVDGDRAIERWTKQVSCESMPSNRGPN